jgi:GNAT superfamily N-acetyltransferase
LPTSDYRERLALVAERQRGATPEIVGVTRYEPEGVPDRREIALVVEDAWQARGLGKVLADNVRMLALIARLGTVIARSTEQVQRRYDAAYEQCMYAKGNQVPGVAPRPTMTAPPPPAR